MLGLCLADDKESTILRMKHFLKCYDNYNHIDDYELENIPMLLNSLAAMYIIQSSFIRSNEGDYTENDYWYTEGKRYLEMNVTLDDIRIR